VCVPRIIQDNNPVVFFGGGRRGKEGYAGGTGEANCLDGGT
jgi:hypothetical protein